MLLVFCFREAVLSVLDLETWHSCEKAKIECQNKATGLKDYVFSTHETIKKKIIINFK